MTVKELREILEEYDDKLEVFSEGEEIIKVRFDTTKDYPYGNLVIETAK